MSFSSRPGGHGRARAPALLAGLVLAIASCTARGPETIPPPALALEEIRAGRPSAASRVFLAGAAVADITPYESAVFMAGFGFNRKSAGIRDPIMARVVYLDDGSTPLVLVSLDLVGIFLTDCERIRSRVTRDLGRTIVIAATHNHQGPDPLGWWGWGIPFLFPLTSGVDEDWMREATVKVAAAILEAAASARPARLRVAAGAAPADLSRNLRRGGTKNDTVRVLRAEEAGGGRAIATLVGYANHAEVLFDENVRLSADYPGALCREIERLDGGVAVFFQGASGGMVAPNLPRETPLAEREVAVEMMGRAIASTASAAVAGGRGEPIEDAKIAVSTADIELPVENWRFRFVERLGLVHREGFGESARTRILLARLGPVAFVTVPGEPTPATGARIAALVSAPHPFLICLGYDEFGYILQPEEFDDPDFDYEVSMSLGRRTAPLVEEAIARLAKQLDSGG